MKLAGTALIAFGGALAFIAAVDVPLALWQHFRSLRMTRQEIREEMRDTEGSPELRGRVRRMQQEMASRRMMAAVPTADVVITNPTHYAVALRYDEARMRAPMVVAKGADLIAQRIRELAGEHAVPLVEAPPLARALHGTCELGDEIPARLYAVVAQVLTYVYQLRTARRSGAMPPAPPVIDAPDASGTVNRVALDGARRASKPTFPARHGSCSTAEVEATPRRRRRHSMHGRTGSQSRQPWPEPAARAAARRRRAASCCWRCWR